MDPRAERALPTKLQATPPLIVHSRRSAQLRSGALWSDQKSARLTYTVDALCQHNLDRALAAN